MQQQQPCDCQLNHVRYNISILLNTSSGLCRLKQPHIACVREFGPYFSGS
jgi:hypothetical protein